jgi:cytochrome c-type biogenesis protein CcmH/NrfG
MSHHSRHAGTPQVPAGYWSPSQSYVLAVITLLIGVAVGYLVRGSSPTDVAAQTPSASSTGSNFGSSGAGQPNRAELTARIVGPLLQQLKTKPNDPGLLVNIGNSYYDGQDYANAIDYYQKALELRPENANVRTDMATAMWYSGDADGAIKQYEQSLKFQPTHAQTLFNMGIVKWQGKKDGKGAIQVWEELLATNPNYSERPKVKQLLDQVKSEAGRGL